MNFNKELEDFETNGYAVIKDAFSIKQLEQFKETLIEVFRIYISKCADYYQVEIPIEVINDPINAGYLWIDHIDHSYISDIYNLMGNIPEFNEFNFRSQRLIQFTKELLTLNTSPLYVLTSRLRMDPPGENKFTFDWHQETFYSIPKSRFVQLWAPLVYPARVENGTLKVLSGSHVETEAKQTWVVQTDRPDQKVIDSSIVKKYQETDIIVDPGSVVVFSSSLIHKSGFNKSNQVRYSLVGSYHDITNPDFKAPKFIANFDGLTQQEYFKEIIGGKIS